MPQMTSRFVNSVANTSGLLPEIGSKTEKRVSGERNSFTSGSLTLNCLVGQGSRGGWEDLEMPIFTKGTSGKEQPRYEHSCWK